MRPDTYYAKSGDIRIAYQVLGSGTVDLVFIPGFISNIDHYWDDPTLAHFLQRLSSFSRLILFDKRGTGLSDRIGNLPTLEERMDDARAVMDAAGSERAAIFGISEGGAMSMLFAATYPERTIALMLYGTYSHFHSHVLPPEQFKTFLERVEQTWGTGESLKAFAPTKVADEHFRHWWARYERLGASPSAVLALMRMNSEIDVRHVLPSIRTPTLVLHRSGDTRVSVEAGRHLASEIGGAKYVELPGENHLLWAGDVDIIADEIEEFLTGGRADVEPDRVLATVMFTDIVDSTGRASAMGDRRWRMLLDQHDAVVRQQIEHFRGREVKTLGDGFLATFDGPARAVRCAQAVISDLRPLGLEIRAGIHAGEIELKGQDIGGIAVHLAARISGLASGGQILASSTVRDLVAGSGIRFTDCGTSRVRGLEDEVRLYSVTS